MTGSDQRRYGRCPCSGFYEERRVEVTSRVAGQVVVVRDVPQGACPTCGSRVYKAAILDAIEGLVCGPAASSS
jgi:YgiT-type zinc finger domain-containing protein